MSSYPGNPRRQRVAGGAAQHQTRAGPDMEENLADAESLVREAADQGASLICLPEFFSCLDFRNGAFEVGDLAEEDHPALPKFQHLAEELGAWIQMGSLLKCVVTPTARL